MLVLLRGKYVIISLNTVAGGLPLFVCSWKHGLNHMHKDIIPQFAVRIAICRILRLVWVFLFTIQDGVRFFTNHHLRIYVLLLEREKRVGWGGREEH